MLEEAREEMFLLLPRSHCIDHHKTNYTSAEILRSSQKSETRVRRENVATFKLLTAQMNFIRCVLQTRAHRSALRLMVHLFKLYS